MWYYSVSDRIYLDNLDVLVTLTFHHAAPTTPHLHGSKHNFVLVTDQQLLVCFVDSALATVKIGERHFPLRDVNPQASKR